MGINPWRRAAGVANPPPSLPPSPSLPLPPSPPLPPPPPLPMGASSDSVSEWIEITGGGGEGEGRDAAAAVVVCVCVGGRGRGRGEAAACMGCAVLLSGTSRLRRFSGLGLKSELCDERCACAGAAPSPPSPSPPPFPSLFPSPPPFPFSFPLSFAVSPALRFFFFFLAPLGEALGRGGGARRPPTRDHLQG